MPVLYGVFLYMGISSLNGIQFMHRIILIFMPEKHQPDYTFLRHVKTIKVHLFTLIQFSSLGLLFAIKSNKSTSILFPIMVLALVGIRKLLDYIFTQKELAYLDDIMPEIMRRSKEDGKEEDPAAEDIGTVSNSRNVSFNMFIIEFDAEFVTHLVGKDMHQRFSFFKTII
jgi:sodium bicarbonate transporter 10